MGPMRSRLCLGVGLLWLAAACGDDVAVEDGGGGHGGTPQGGDGQGGAQPTPPSVSNVSAPDQFTVLITLAGEVTQAPATANAYELSGTMGDLTVEGVSFDAVAKTITLATSKQKLGVTYFMTIRAPGDPLDLESRQFLSADTARFWATDFTDFSDYELTARRVGVSDQMVVYAEEGLGDPDGIDEAMATFENDIIPIETAAFAPLPDRDENGRLLLLGLNGGGYYGGYFSGINALTEEEAQQFGYHSNEMEMLYVSVPDLGDTFDSRHTLAHEFSHLLYNEVHGLFGPDWSWHNEGLAECAVHLVYGENAESFYYTSAPELADGQSLIIWQYANYAQYIQAYVFLTYVASRLGGVTGFAEMYALSGDPDEFDAFLNAELGQGLPATHLDMLTAAFLQEPSGVHGFNGLLTLTGQPQLASTAPLELLPYTGVFLPAAANGLTPQGGGAEVVFRGVESGSPADLVAPFDVGGGAVIALNTLPNPETMATQSSGTLTMAFTGQPSAAPKKLAPHHLDGRFPPPIKPHNLAERLAWRRAVHGF